MTMNHSYNPPARPERDRPRALRPIRSGDAGAAERDRQHIFFLTHLRSTTTRSGKPFKENAIATHDDALIALDKWLTAMDFAGDYRDVDTPTLSAFLRYWATNYSQGGANTKQRKLSPFFKWLSDEYEVPNPYTDKLARYSPTPPEETARILEDEVVRALLKVTSPKTWPSADRKFVDIRDHAIIRMFAATGARRGQLAYMRVEDLDLRDRTVAVIGQKGTRDGNRKPFGFKAAEAVARYLRVRASHKLATSADEGWLWLGTRGRGHLSGNALLTMLKRRAQEAGYPPEVVHPHMFRHTYANEHYESGGEEGDLMRHMDWTDRKMLDVYAANVAQKRAIEDAKRRAIGDRW